MAVYDEVLVCDFCDAEGLQDELLSLWAVLGEPVLLHGSCVSALENHLKSYLRFSICIQRW